MNKFIKLALVSAIVAPALLATAAFASTTQTAILFDGVPSESITVGSSADARLTFNNTGNSTVQSVKVELVGSGVPGVCLDVNDQNSTGTHTVNFPVDTVGGTEGTWDVRTTTYGTVVPGANNNCDDTIGTHTTHTFQNQLTLTDDSNSGTIANNTGNGSGTSSGSSTSVLSQILAAITALAHPATPTPPAGNAAKCALIAPFLGATPYAYSPMGIQLQSALLLDNPYSIPLLAAGSSVTQGYFGIQTHAALSSYDQKYGC